MSDEIKSGQHCARAWELMPWVLQDSAPPEQGEWLTRHVAQCESCSAEFARQSRLRCALSLPTDIPVDVDVGWNHLLERLDDPAREASPRRLWSGNRLAIALAAAVMVQAIAIGALGIRLWSDPPAPYRTLSQPARVEPVGAIRVVPSNSMTVSDWNSLLHNLDLRVVDGPNAVGAYTVVPKESPARTTQLVRELRSSRSIRLAEPTGDRR